MMPKIIYGTAWKKERTADLVYTALSAGFRGVDTACQPKHYREDLVGAGVRRALSEGVCKREDLWLQTKFTSVDGQDTTQALPYDPAMPVDMQVRQSIGTSLDNLGVERIDSVVLHSPLRTRVDTLTAYRALENFVGLGTVGALGVSNIYDAAELEWLISEAKVKPAVVQNRWHEGNGWDWEVFDTCKRHGIAYQSFWTLTGSPSLLAFKPVTELAKRKGITPQQTVYRLCELWGITPLCGSTNPQHMAEALAAEKAFGADEPEVQVVWDALRKHK